LIKARKDLVNEEVGELGELRVWLESLHELGNPGSLVLFEVEDLHEFGDSGVDLGLGRGVGILVLLQLGRRNGLHRPLRSLIGPLAARFGFSKLLSLLGLLFLLAAFAILRLHLALHVLHPVLELLAALLNEFVLGLAVCVVFEDGEDGRGPLFWAPDLEEWVGVGLRGLALLAEVEIFEDRGFVEVADDRGDPAAVADVAFVDGEVGLFSFLNPLHFGKIVRNMGLIPVQNLGNLKSDLRNRLGDSLVNLFLDLALHLLLPGHLLHLAPAGHFLGFHSCFMAFQSWQSPFLPFQSDQYFSLPFIMCFHFFMAIFFFHIFFIMW